MLSTRENEIAVRKAVIQLMQRGNVRFTLPVKLFYMNYVTVSKKCTGIYIKLGNIFVNARKFFHELPSLIVISFYLKEPGWLMNARAFIALWQQLLHMSKLHIDKILRELTVENLAEAIAGMIKDDPKRVKEDIRSFLYSRLDFMCDPSNYIFFCLRTAI